MVLTLSKPVSAETIAIWCYNCQNFTTHIMTTDDEGTTYECALCGYVLNEEEGEEVIPRYQHKDERTRNKH